MTNGAEAGTSERAVLGMLVACGCETRGNELTCDGDYINLRGYLAWSGLLLLGNKGNLVVFHEIFVVILINIF